MPQDNTNETTQEISVVQEAKTRRESKARIARVNVAEKILIKNESYQNAINTLEAAIGENEQELTKIDNITDEMGARDICSNVLTRDGGVVREVGDFLRDRNDTMNSRRVKSIFED